jgi:hypothetical protein
MWTVRGGFFLSFDERGEWLERAGEGCRGEREGWKRKNPNQTRIAGANDDFKPLKVFLQIVHVGTPTSQSHAGDRCRLFSSSRCWTIYSPSLFPASF